MSAKIHRLFGTEARPVPEAPRAVPPEAGGASMHPLILQLHQRYSELLIERFEAMFEGADDLLFDMSRRAATNSEQRLYMDTMRTLRLERPGLTERFAHAIDACFRPDYSPHPLRQSSPVDFDKLSLQDNATLEQNIAVANMETKAANLFRQSLWEIERRLGWLIRMHNVPVSPLALAPGGLCTGFRNAIKPVNVEIDIKLVLYKLFDALVVGELGWVYGELLQLLDQSGIQTPAQDRESGGGGGAYVPGSGPGALPAAYGGGLPEGLSARGGGPTATPLPLGVPPLGAMPQVDPNTLEALRYLAAATTRSPQHSDAALAEDLARAAAGQPLPGLDMNQAWALLQRAELVGRMFKGMLGDPNIPEPIKPLIEEMRFPAIKTALYDRAFLTDSGHPLRAFLSELTNLAASTRGSGSIPPAGLDQLVQQMRARFNPASEKLETLARTVEPMAASDIERFLEDQIFAGQQRRKAILDKARKVVAQELEIALLGRALPAPVQTLLKSGWAPMMGVALLRSGIESPAWAEGQRMLQRVITSVAADAPQRVQVREGLLPSLESGFAEVGMAADKAQSLLDGVLGLWAQLDAEVTAQPTAPQGFSVADFEGLAGEAALAPEPLSSAEAAPQPVAAANTAERHPGPPDPAAAAAGLARAEAEAETAVATAPEMPPLVAPALPTPEQLLALLLTAGAWFRIFDRRSTETRWLKVTSYSVGAGRVAFAEFDGNNVLVLTTRALMDDLLARRSEPIDPTPAVKLALDHYVSAGASGSPSG